MEESTNTFTGGLNQDLNPIATPDNVLTDAKNATFITFNGNEMSLQNDMGNTKITYTDPLNNTKQSVTLPQGYVPLGVKEYGGILYIVSKNPSTDQVEIGSFPSPEFVTKEDGTPLSTEETKITDDNGVLLHGQSTSESGIFDITTEILHPCDIIKDYSFFPLNFETISTENERRLFKYKLINSSTRKDITNLSKPFNLSSKVYYQTLQLTKGGKQKYPVVVIFPGGGEYTYSTDGTESGTKPDEFASYIYDVEGEVRLSMYYEGEAGIQYTFGPARSGKKISTQSRDNETYPLHDFKYGGDGIYYFPNLQPGALSFKFYTETIDYFNLHRIEDQIVKYSPELVKEAIRLDDDEIKKIIESFKTTFFTDGNGATPKQFKSLLNISGNTIRPYTTNKYSLQICPENGQIYSRLDTFNSDLADESNRFMTLYWNGNEFDPTIEMNDKEYYLKFDKIKLSQPSWVKVNKVQFYYEIFHNDNPSVIIKKYSEIHDNIRVNNNEWDISDLSIKIPFDEREVRLGVFIGRQNAFPNYLGSVSDDGENISLSPFAKIKVSSAEGPPNYTVRFSFTPYNTDYNIDISQFKIDRVIDLTKSPDSWEGNLVFKDNLETIKVSLDNCVIQYTDSTRTKKFTTLEECQRNDNLSTSTLYKKYVKSEVIPLVTEYRIFSNGNVDYASMDVIPSRPQTIISGVRCKEYDIKQDNVITLLNQTDPQLYKYFEWGGTISPSIETATGSFLMGNSYNTSTNEYYRIYNILKVEVDNVVRNLSTNIKIKKDKAERIPAPDTMQIKSENGIFNGKKIQRGFRGERYDDKYDSFISLITHTKNDKAKEWDIMNSRYIGFSISANTFKYLGSKNKTSRFSKLYYISKNASTTPCDSFGKTLVESELPEDAKGFDNIISENEYSGLYTSIVPIKSKVLSRANIVNNKTYSSSSFSPSNYFTFAFYISPKFTGNLSCNANVLKLSIDNDVKSDDFDSVIFNTPEYSKDESINIKSGTKKYNRVVLICYGLSSGSNFTFKFLSSNGGIIYNPILYNSRFIEQSESGAISADLRGQGMKLTFSEDISEFNNKKLGGYKLHADYVPEPFYEIID